MSAWNRPRFAARLPLPGLSLLVALLLVFVVACGGEDDPTSTPPPAAQPAATSTPAPAAPTMAMPAAPTMSKSHATATTGSSYDDYSSPSKEATEAAEDEPTEEPAAAPEEVAIAIQGFLYQPAEITVPVGTTITWTNMDTAPHTATADDGTFNTGVLNQNESASVTFDTPGTYTYFCAVHPSMVATVIVTG